MMCRFNVDNRSSQEVAQLLAKEAKRRHPPGTIVMATLPFVAQSEEVYCLLLSCIRLFSPLDHKVCSVHGLKCPSAQLGHVL